MVEMADLVDVRASEPPQWLHASALQKACPGTLAVLKRCLCIPVSVAA